MGYIQVGEENSDKIELHYHDQGAGQPVILIHGWPLSERSWEKQVPALLAKGYRVISYDRRGFGESSKPSHGYDYDTLADDLNKIITHLDLRNVVLVGFSMGAGEVARYLGTFGADRVAKAVIISGILPALLKSKENPDGVEGKIFEDIKKKIVEDRLAYLSEFFNDFYSHSILSSNQVSDEVLRFSWLLAAPASPIGTLSTVSSWLEDFRGDVERIKIPCLIIHGDSDHILPIEATGYRTRELLPHAKFVEIEGGPHGVLMTHPNEVNEALLDFCGEPTREQYQSSEIRH